MPEDPSPAAVGKEKRREQADERRLPRAVLAEDGDGLTLLHRERDAVERHARAALAALLAALAGVLATELLAQLVDLDGYALLNGHGLHDYFLYVDHCAAPSVLCVARIVQASARPYRRATATGVSDTREELHNSGTLAAELDEVNRRGTRGGLSEGEASAIVGAGMMPLQRSNAVI